MNIVCNVIVCVLCFNKSRWGFSAKFRLIIAELRGEYATTTFRMRMEVEVVAVALQWLSETTKITIVSDFQSTLWKIHLGYLCRR